MLSFLILQRRDNGPSADKRPSADKDIYLTNWKVHKENGLQNHYYKCRLQLFSSPQPRASGSLKDRSLRRPPVRRSLSKDCSPETTGFRQRG